MNEPKTYDVQAEDVKMEIVNTAKNDIINEQDFNKPYSIFKEIQEHNEKMLNEVPGLKDSTMPIVGNQFFNPKTYEDVTEERIEILKRDFPDMKVDDQNMLHTDITVDDQPITLHQHISNLVHVSSSFKPTSALNFNLNSIKKIFDHKIPLCFKQSVVLLAMSKKDPEVLNIAFENDELVELQKLMTTELLKLENKDS